MRQKFPIKKVKKECALLAASVVFLFSACGISHFKSRPSRAAFPPLMPVASSPVIPPNANILIHSQDQISFFEEDGASYLKIYVDHHYVGRTNIAPKSASKKWGAVLNSGRHLFRFEKWDLQTSGNWRTLAPRSQPRSRWISIDLSSQTVVSVNFYNHELKHSVSIQIHPLPKTK